MPAGSDRARPEFLQAAVSLLAGDGVSKPLEQVGRRTFQSGLLHRAAFFHRNA